MNESYNPFLQIIKSFEGLFVPNTYYKLRKQTTGSKFICALLVAIFLSLITFGIGAAKLRNNKMLAAFMNDIPEFVFDGELLTLANRYEQTSKDTYILIDTSVPYYSTNNDSNTVPGAVNISDSVKQIAANNSVTQAMFVSSSNIIVVKLLTGQVQNAKFSNLTSILHIGSFSKDTIVSGYKGFIGKWAAIIGALAIPFELGSFFLKALIYCLLGLIVKAIMKADDDFNTIYWLTFYILIPLTVLKTLIKSSVSIGGTLIGFIFFILFFVILVITLKNGDSNSGAPQMGYVVTDTFEDTYTDNYNSYNSFANNTGNNSTADYTGHYNNPGNTNSFTDNYNNDNNMY